MFILKREPLCSFSLSPSLLLVITLFFPLKLLGADQPVPQAEPPASTPAQTDPQTSPSAPPQAAPPPPVLPTQQSDSPTQQFDSPTQQSDSPAQQSDSIDTLDVPRNYMSEKIISFAGYMDRFFGGNRHFQESNQSVLQLDLTRIVGYGDNHKFDLSGKMKLRLPGTEGRLRLWLETDPENEIYDDPTKDTHTLQRRDTAAKSTALAARYTTAEEKALRFSADVGVKLPISHLDPFTRMKVEYSAPVGDWRMKVSESVYWFNTLGVGETTQLDLEKILSPSRLFRSTSNATWLRDKQNFDLVQSFSVFHTLNSRSALIYQANANWITNPYFQAVDYVMLVFYRYRLHQKWLFLELSPQLHFPKEKDYEASPAFSLRLVALFDESK